MSANSEVKESKRLLSLDIFRGLTITLMIIVNSPGSNSPYPILDHAAWNGCTFADLVFPFFLFIVGLTLTISLKKHLENETKTEVYLDIIKRSALMLLLGLWLNAFPTHYELSTVRLYGILQRIAVCYLICSFIFLKTQWKTQVVIFLGILIGYWILLTKIPVPGHGVKQLTPEGTWVAYFDQLLLSPRYLYHRVYDPEGFLSTFPAIATTLSGVLLGHCLTSNLAAQKKALIIFSFGIDALLIGWFWSGDFPINKNIWTSTYVLWTSGLAAIVFTVCYWVVDIQKKTALAWPLKVLGTNALFAFVFHVMLLKASFEIHMSVAGGKTLVFNQWVTAQLFGDLSPQNGSLCFSLLFLGLNFLVVWWLYRRKIFIKL